MPNKLFSYCKYILIFALSVIMCSCTTSSNLTKSPVGLVQTRGTALPPPLPAGGKIALLLPLHGPLAANGLAIRNGFLAAYYGGKQQLANNLQVRVLDTSTGNVQDLYHQAVVNGAQFVVGPLTKEDVSAVMSMGNLPVPTLALNSVANSNPPANLFQFGLSPVDEAVQAAQRARQQNHQRVIVISPADAWGTQIAEAFRQQWLANGGTVADSFAYSAHENLAQGIRRVLLVNTSEGRTQQISHLLHEKVESTPERRQDIDAIFLNALPNEARQIRPLLKFYFAGDVPVYATSALYSGRIQPQQDQDLDGIQFCDMPWVLASDEELPSNLGVIRQNVKQTWPSSFNRFPKLYALGVDAYQLTQQLNQLAGNGSIRGATGTLYLANNRHIYRHLTWAKMENGRPRIIN